MKMTKELSRVLRAASKEVNKWPKWKRSIDAGKIESQKAVERFKFSMSRDW